MSLGKKWGKYRATKLAKIKNDRMSVNIKAPET